MKTKHRRLGSSLPPTSNVFSNHKINLLDRLRAWPRYELTSDDRSLERDHWLSAVKNRNDRGASARVLFVYGQLPGETGSGVYLQQIAAESVRQGLDLYLLSAGYHPLDSRDIPGVPAERIFTCLFTPEGKTPQTDAVKTPISGMSVVMPYPVLAYRDRTEAEMLDLLTTFGNRIAELIFKLNPNVIHINHLWLLNGLARLATPWIPLVASAHGTANKLILDTPRFRELMVPCVSSVDHVCAISPESVLECRNVFVLPSHVEPFGLVLMEALACGTPAVFGNVGGPPSYVPQSLRHENLAVPVDPIKMNKEGNALAADRQVYAARLAGGMETILRRKIDSNDRIRIADAMKLLSWSRLVESLSRIYDRLSERSLSNFVG